jgi:CheY-like chemotaxis protein
MIFTQHAHLPYFSQRRYITMEQPRVLVVVDDLFFLAKIQTTLKHLGLTAQVLTQRAAIQAYVEAAVTPVLVVVDLTIRTDDAVAVIKAIRAIDSGAPIAILAFGAHVAVETQQQALQAGADRVVAKSTFAHHLPDLIQQFVMHG